VSATDWLAYLRDTLAAIAGAAAVVYITGGLIVGLRLYVARLPAVSVIGQLPRNVLLSAGLSEGLFPALFLGSIYAALRSVIYERPESRRTTKDGVPRLGKANPRKKADCLERAWGKMRDWWACLWHGNMDRLQRTWGEKKGNRDARIWHIVWILVATAIVMAPALVSTVTDRKAVPRGETQLWIVNGALTIVTLLGMLLYLNMRAQIAKKFSNNFTGVSATVLHSLLFALVLAPGCEAYWRIRPLEEAKVCMTHTPT
jgi:hypothetical protein